MHLHLLLQVALLLTQPSPSSSGSVVTKEDVLLMMSKVPAVEVTPKGMEERPGHWERRRDAGRIAEVIALVAPSVRDAGRLVVYAAFEGGNSTTAVGDGGKAHGPLQLQGAWGLQPLEMQFRYWLDYARRSEQLCAANAPNARLAAVASGNCTHGLVLVARREAFVDRVVAALELSKILASPETASR